METLECASDWEEMRLFADQLIAAQRQGSDYPSKVEEKGMQPQVRDLLSKVLGVKIQHTSLTGFERRKAFGHGQEAGKPDGVIYHSQDSKRVIVIIEMKMEEGARELSHTDAVLFLSLR